MDFHLLGEILDQKIHKLIKILNCVMLCWYKDAFESFIMKYVLFEGA